MRWSLRFRCRKKCFPGNIWRQESNFTSEIWKEILVCVIDNARRIFTVLKRLHGLEQKLAHLNHVGVANAKMLSVPVHDGPHTLSDARILSGESLDACIARRFLGLSIL